MTSFRTLTRTASAAAVGVLTASALRRHRRRAAKAAPDLRGPAMHLVPSLSSPARLRLFRSAAPILAAAGRRDVTREEHTADGVRVLIYDPGPRETASGALLWIHGGGLIAGVAEDVGCARYAREAGVLVVSVDYRLAPEHPFPAPLDDCASALRWLHDHATELGIDPDRIAVGGASAGGGLTAALCQRAHDEGGPPIAFQLLIYPMLDDRTVLRTDLDPDGLYTWTPESNLFAWTAYLGETPSLDAEPPPYAAPGRRGDLSGLPPWWMGVGDVDLFHDEAVAYAERLTEAGVPGSRLVVPGLWHAADMLAAGADTSQRFTAAAIAALRAAIGPADPGA